MIDIAGRNARMLKLSDEGASYAEIGREVGLSRNRARQIVLKGQRLRRESTLSELGKLNGEE